MLRDYEILFIVRPELDEEQMNASVETVTTLVKNLGGIAEAPNVWGKRRLAYEVAHLREGYYVLTDFQLEPARVPELEATVKISETIFRHLVVRKPEKVVVKPVAATTSAETKSASTEEVPPAAADEAPSAAEEPAPAPADEPAATPEPAAAAATEEKA